MKVRMLVVGKMPCRRSENMDGRRYVNINNVSLVVAVVRGVGGALVRKGKEKKGIRKALLKVVGRVR